MQIGSYIDGRELTYDQQSGQFAVGDTPVTLEQVLQYDDFAQIEWLNDETRTWARDLPSGVGEAVSDTAPRSRRLLGFRSRHIWKMVVASVYYAFWVVFALAVVLTRTAHAVDARDIAIEVVDGLVLAVLMISPALFLSDFGYRRRLPIFKHRKAWLSAVGFMVFFLLCSMTIGLADFLHSSPYKAAVAAERAVEQKQQEADRAAEQKRQEAERAAQQQKQEAERATEQKRQEAERAVEQKQQEADRAAEQKRQEAERAAQQQKQVKVAPAVQEEKIAKIGNPLKVGDLVFTVKKADTTTELKSIFGHKTGNWMLVTVTVRNESKEAVTINTDFFKLIESDGSTYETDSDNLVYVDPEQLFFLEKINPKLEKTGVALFAVPKGVKELKLHVQTGFWGTETGEIALIR